MAVYLLVKYTRQAEEVKRHVDSLRVDYFDGGGELE